MAFLFYCQALLLRKKFLSETDGLPLETLNHSLPIWCRALAAGANDQYCCNDAGARNQIGYSERLIEENDRNHHGRQRRPCHMHSRSDCGNFGKPRIKQGEANHRHHYGVIGQQQPSPRGDGAEIETAGVNDRTRREQRDADDGDPGGDRDRRQSHAGEFADDREQRFAHDGAKDQGGKVHWTRARAARAGDCERWALK